MTTYFLQKLAQDLARPAFCEVVLHRFLRAVQDQCTTEQQVRDLFKLWRQGKAPQQKKVRVVDET